MSNPKIASSFWDAVAHDINHLPEEADADTIHWLHNFCGAGQVYCVVRQSRLKFNIFSFIMFLEEALIRYVYKDYASTDDLTIENVNKLVEQFGDEYAEAPFCNLGDFDLDDLREYIPESWTILKTGSALPGQIRMAIVEIIYGVEQQFDTSVEGIELEAFELCGLHPLSCRDFEKHPDVFGEESYVPDAGTKSLLFSYTYPSLVAEDGNNVADTDECGIDEVGVITEKLCEWKEWIENPSTQDEYDERMKMLRFLG